MIHNHTTSVSRLMSDHLMSMRLSKHGHIFAQKGSSNFPCNFSSLSGPQSLQEKVQHQNKIIVSPSKGHLFHFLNWWRGKTKRGNSQEESAYNLPNMSSPLAFRTGSLYERSATPTTRSSTRKSSIGNRLDVPSPVNTASPIYIHRRSTSDDEESFVPSIPSTELPLRKTSLIFPLLYVGYASKCRNGFCFPHLSMIRLWCFEFQSQIYSYIFLQVFMLHGGQCLS